MNTPPNTVLYIQIEGPIGVGKSSTIQKLVERTSMTRREDSNIVFMQQQEDLDTWNFSAQPGVEGLFDEFLTTKDTKLDKRLQAAANLQAVIFALYLRQGQESAGMIKNHQHWGDVIVVQERSLRASREVFLPLQEMKDQDRNMLEALGAGIECRLPKPDLVFYIDAGPDVCLTRCRERGRRNEENYTIEYFQHMENLYNKMLLEYGLENKLHRITDLNMEINNSKLRSASQKIMNICMEKLKEKRQRDVEINQMWK